MTGIGIKNHKAECPCTVCQRMRGDYVYTKATRKKLSIAAVKNMTGRTLPESTKEKLRLAALGHVCSDSAKEKLRKLRKGKSWEEQYGKNKADKSKKKLSRSQMGKEISQTARKKISKALTGRKVSKVSLEKRIGRKVSKESIEKRRVTLEKKKRLRKKLQQYEKLVIFYQDLAIETKEKLNIVTNGNDKIYIPYHPDKNKDEREKLMNEFEKRGWKYVDARRIWDAPFNRWLYFWILKK